MKEIMFSVPSWLLVTVTTLLSALFAVTVLKMLRRKFPWDKFKENHEVGGFLFNALGLIYAVIVAFVMYISWGEHSEAMNYSDNEVSQLRELYYSSSAFDAHHRDQIRSTIRSYIVSVIDDEWPAMTKGKHSEKSRKEFYRLWDIYLGMNDINDQKTLSVYQRSLGDLNDLSDYRIMRLATIKKGIPTVVWTVIVIGALTSVGFSLFFGTRDVQIQAAMTALFAMTNALILLLIFFLDNPFSGDTGVQPIIFKEFLHLIDTNAV